MAMFLQSGFNQNNDRGRGRNGNQKGRGRGFNNFGPNFGFNNGQTSGNPNFGFNSGQSSGTANATPQFLGFQSHSQLKNGGNSSGFHQVQGQSQNSRPTCQICGKNEHTALDCYHLMNFACQGRHALAKLASMAASSMAALATANFALASNSAWLTDTRCSDHVTQDLSQLSLHSQVTSGNESVIVGNGQELPVTHIGNGKLLTSSHQFRLDNILRVPALASNLLSVHKLCLQNNVYCYFDATQFLIVDLPTGKVLYQGQSKDGVYPIPFSSQLFAAPTTSSSFAFQSFVNSVVSPQVLLWH